MAAEWSNEKCIEFVEELNPRAEVSSEAQPQKKFRSPKIPHRLKLKTMRFPKFTSPNQLKAFSDFGP
jgi:hypothetical protein